MNLQKLYQKIELQEEMVQLLAQAEKEVDFAEADSLLQQLSDIRTAEAAQERLAEYLKEDDGNIKMLLCHLECARRDYEKYQALHIEETVYVETMKCFTRFIDECRIRTGKVWFDRSWWTYRQISMSLFRIGELEYEMCENKGEPVISLHIPSNAVFTNEQVEESLRMAKNFFATHYPEYQYTKMICNSWLMSTVLAELLPENSNIVQFQKRFEILQMHPENNAFMEWLFQSSKDAPYETLPERTSLQRKVKQHLLAGGYVGEGDGVMRV